MFSLRRRLAVKMYTRRQYGMMRSRTQLNATFARDTTRTDSAPAEEKLAWTTSDNDGNHDNIKVTTAGTTLLSCLPVKLPEDHRTAAQISNVDGYG